MLVIFGSAVINTFSFYCSTRVQEREFLFVRKQKKLLLLHFQHLLFLLKWSFVYEYTLQKIVTQRFCLDLPRLEGNTFSCETVEEAANSLFRCKFV